jgi:hypothetical protein
VLNYGLKVRECEVEIRNKWSSKKGAGEIAFVTFVKEN